MQLGMLGIVAGRFKVCHLIFRTFQVKLSDSSLILKLDNLTWKLIEKSVSGPSDHS